MANRNIRDHENGSFAAAVAVTKSDTTDLGITRGLYIGGAGNVAVEMTDGALVTFTALAVGVVHPLSVQKVLAATTATGIVALY